MWKWWGDGTIVLSSCLILKAYSIKSLCSIPNKNRTLNAGPYTKKAFSKVGMCLLKSTWRLTKSNSRHNKSRNPLSGTTLRPWKWGWAPGSSLVCRWAGGWGRCWAHSWRGGGNACYTETIASRWRNAWIFLHRCRLFLNTCSEARSGRLCVVRNWNGETRYLGGESWRNVCWM